MNDEDIVKILLENKVITENQLDQAKGEHKLSGIALTQVLLSKGFVGEEDLAQSLAQQLDLSYIKLSQKDLNSQVVNLVSRDLALRHKAVPVKADGNNLEVAFAAPWDLPVIEEFHLITGFKIKPLVASAKEIDAAITRYFRAEDSSKQTLIDMRFEKFKEAEEAGAENSQEELGLMENVPVVRLLDDIIEGAVSSGASDIHLDPQFPEMIVRYRIDGVLHDIMNIPKHIEAALISRVKVLANMDITESRMPQDGHIIVDKEERKYDIRISTVLTVNGENVVMRILDKNSLMLNLEKLGLDSRDVKVFSNLIEKPYGMILVTGPTGSGKSSTLYAVLNILDSKTTNIITIEEPVEYHLDGITQIQVDPGAKISFATGLRTILRQDPDTIMVGEIRDRETVEVAVQAAMTGHLMLSTLHTNDAASAVTRLIDIGVEPFLVSSTLIGVLAQRLCRVICKECKEEYVPSGKELEFLQKEGVDTKGLKLARGKGCDFCYHTGFKGRTGIFEIMEMSDEIRKLIMDRRSKTEITEIARREGMRTLRENGLQKIIDKVSTVDEIRRLVYIG
ncbi:MAG: Flp pilus assembly complex ATPase component [Candidatus Omnitrophica bacterium]|nr:Flp pilus assembly complex ATPase component [Candidatus Omnitrophota bacterium]